MFKKQPAIYILASNLPQRIYQHKHDLAEGFTKKYCVHLCVYYELHETMETAITREKQIKKWNRQWKLALIEKENPDWKDLYEDIV